MTILLTPIAQTIGANTHSQLRRRRVRCGKSRALSDDSHGLPAPPHAAARPGLTSPNRRAGQSGNVLDVAQCHVSSSGEFPFLTRATSNLEISGVQQSRRALKALTLKTVSAR